MKILSVAALTCCITCGLHAQENTPQPSLPPLPPGPLVEKRAPDFSQWVVKASSAADSQKASGVTDGKNNKLVNYWGSQVVITKTGKLMLRQTVDEHNQTWDTWCVGEVQITIYPDGKHWIVQTTSLDPTIPAANFEDYSQSDFADISWISLKNYAGIRDIKGRKCIVFQDRFKLSPDDTGPSTTTAYVDLETRYPLAVTLGGQTRTYEFRSIPQQMLSLPPLVQTLLDNREKSRQSVTRRLPVSN